ncbi:unnamed protein product [Cuscuta campestris]|uniref:Uncharacterized protein n=1 Tax=Cuscuta campestris TaxID=132261 RepID=A0A484MWD2_9ASTE|nr:unnamed protein product [Cuscuta campestris]
MGTLAKYLGGTLTIDLGRGLYGRVCVSRVTLEVKLSALTRVDTFWHSGTGPLACRWIASTSLMDDGDYCKINISLASFGCMILNEEL